MFVKQDMPISASQMTVLTSDGNIIFHNGSPVVCHSLEHALQNFDRWGNYFKHFDSLVLCRALKKVTNIELDGSFSRFCDTLEFFIEIHSDPI